MNKRLDFQGFYHWKNMYVYELIIFWQISANIKPVFLYLKFKKKNEKKWDGSGENSKRASGKCTW